MQTFGQQLTAARKAANLTQGQLAEKLHVGRTTISNWECDRAEPDLNTVNQLRNVLGFDFFAENETGEKEESATGEPYGNGESMPEPSEGEAAQSIAAPNEDDSTSATRSISGTKWILPVLLAAVLLIAGIILVPRLFPGKETAVTDYTDGAGKVYRVEDYKSVAENDPSKAYLSFTMGTKIQNGSPTGHCMYSFIMKEENGIGFHIDRIDHVTFFHNGTVSVNTYTDEDIVFWEENPDIPAYGTYEMQCGDPTKTPSGEPNATGGALEVFVTDENGHQLSFSAYVPLPQL